MATSELVPATGADVNGPLYPTSGAAALQLAFDLGAQTTPVSLDLRDPLALTYMDWENIGRAVGFVGNAWQWWVGDWLNFGESLFGEVSGQAVDDRASRYDLARRITGKDQGTLQNIRSICGRVPRENRRAELDFTHHAKVASLDPEEQAVWLERAVECNWNTSELAEAIKAEKNPPEEDGDPSPGPGGGYEVSLSDLRDAALALVYRQSEPLSDGDYRLPAEVYAQVGTALGEQ